MRERLSSRGPDSGPLWTLVRSYRKAASPSAASNVMSATRQEPTLAYGREADLQQSRLDAIAGGREQRRFVAEDVKVITIVR